MYYNTWYSLTLTPIRDCGQYGIAWPQIVQYSTATDVVKLSEYPGSHRSSWETETIM